MAKTVAKPAKATVKKNAKPKVFSIEEVAEIVLDKLRTLPSTELLQSEVEWCLGSYRNDRNPVGLLEKIAEALVIFKAELAKKTKGITAKLVSDIKKTLAG